MTLQAAYDELIDRLTRCRSVLVTTHARPDGDALGTSGSLVASLRSMNLRAELLLPTRCPQKYRFVLDDLQIEPFDCESPERDLARFGDYDALLICDTGTWSQLAPLRQRIESFTGPKLVLDHHLTQESWADLHVVDTKAAAAGEMAFTLLDRWSRPIPPPTAQALYVAIVSDTGWFQFSSTTADTLRIAASLIERGVDVDRVNQLLNQNERLARLAIQTRAMQSMRLLDNARVAILSLDFDDFRQSDASTNDTENLVNIPLQAAEVKIAALVAVDPSGGPVRVSLRSKGQVNCAELAGRIGGGGHARAAGAKLDLPLDQATQTVRQLLVGNSTADGL